MRFDELVDTDKGAASENWPANGLHVVQNPTLHRWLDGDVDVSVVRAVAGSDVTELWTQIRDETEGVYLERMPEGMRELIMEALPRGVYESGPWYVRFWGWVCARYYTLLGR